MQLYTFLQMHFPFPVMSVYIADQKWKAEIREFLCSVVVQFTEYLKIVKANITLQFTLQ